MFYLFFLRNTKTRKITRFIDNISLLFKVDLFPLYTRTLINTSITFFNFTLNRDFNPDYFISEFSFNSKNSFINDSNEKPL